MKVIFSIVLLILLALVGPTVPREDERIRRVDNGLIPLNANQPARLADRMQFYKVPGVSVAVTIPLGRSTIVIELVSTK